MAKKLSPSAAEVECFLGCQLSALKSTNKTNLLNSPCAYVLHLS